MSENLNNTINYAQHADANRVLPSPHGRNNVEPGTFRQMGMQNTHPPGRNDTVNQSPCIREIIQDGHPPGPEDAVNPLRCELPDICITDDMQNQNVDPLQPDAVFRHTKYVQHLKDASAPFLDEGTLLIIEEQARRKDREDLLRPCRNTGSNHLKCNTPVRIWRFINMTRTGRRGHILTGLSGLRTMTGSRNNRAHILTGLPAPNSITGIRKISSIPTCILRYSGKSGQVITIVILTLWAILLLFPLFWMFITAFLKPERIMTGSLSPVTSLSDFSLDNMRSLFRQSMILTWIANSLIVASGVTVLSLLISSLAGFVFARREFPGKEFFFWLILATMMIPGQVIVVPLYILMCKLNLIDTLMAVILPGLTSPFGIFMMRTHMASIPRDLEDAARIDGAGELGIYRHVIIPMSLPVLGTLAIFTFMTYWNAFLWPLIVLYDARRYTLSVGLATLQGQHVQDYGLLMAGAAIASIPMLIVFFFFARFLTRGLSAGAIKD